MKEERNFYAFEIKSCGGNFIKLRKFLNGKCNYESEYKWLGREEQTKLRNKMMYESFYLNYQKDGIPKVLNLNGFEITKENEKFVIKYFISGIKTAQSSYNLNLINDKKEKLIIEKLSNFCLNNMEAENEGHSLIFMVHEVERVIFN